MKSDAELFQVILGVMEQMAGDVLDVPTRDYFGPDMFDEPLTDEEFARLADLKGNVSMSMHMAATNVAIIEIKYEAD